MDFEWLMGGLAFLGTPKIEHGPELSATTGAIREKEGGACAECRPSSPGYFASTAPASEDALAGTGGEVPHPSSPLQIHDGKTIERLISAVVVCEERAK